MSRSPKLSDDTTPGHLTWLIDKRSDNQKASLDLYKIITKHRDKIRGDDDLETITETLVAYAFSLWRAVFLADVAEISDNVIEDATDFLTKLLAHNAIGYQQDRGARHWAFVYYVNNADFRMKWLVDKPKIKVLTEADVGSPADGSVKAWWVRDHDALVVSILNFEKILEQ